MGAPKANAVLGGEHHQQHQMVQADAAVVAHTAAIRDASSHAATTAYYTAPSAASTKLAPRELIMPRAGE